MVGHCPDHLYASDIDVGDKLHPQDRRARGSSLVQEQRPFGNSTKGRETMTEDELIQQMLAANKTAEFYKGRAAALDAEVDYLRGVVNTLLENLMGKK